MTDQEDGVGDIEVGVRTRGTVRPEGLDQGDRRGRRAQSRVAVNVGSTDPGFGDERERVVLLEEELPRVVEAMRPGAVQIDCLLRAFDDQAHCLVPGCGFEASAPTDQGHGQPIGAGVGLPSVQAFRAEPPVIDAIAGSTADADDPAAGHADVKAAPR